MKRPSIVINARQKERFVYASAAGALGQTYPCTILLSDQGSTDGTFSEMERAVATAPRGADHEVKLLHCPVIGAYSMKSANSHMMWLVEQSDSDFVFQSSADDYSLPDRIRVCMEAVEHTDCSAVATTMFFLEPGQKLEGSVPVSGFPQQSGYVQAGEGLLKLAYGSTIAGYRRDFLLGLGEPNEHTPDVYWGFLAALDKGFYVVANPQHVHCTHADTNNTGFQGKMKAASGDELMKLTEANHYQLSMLYQACYIKAMELHPEGIEEEASQAVLNMVLGQAFAWANARTKLHQSKITPMILP